MKLQKIEDIDSGVIWVTPTDFTEHIDLNHEEDEGKDIGPIRFVLRLQYTEYWSEEWAEQEGKYHVEIWAAAPRGLIDEAMQSCLSSIGMEREEYDKLDPMVQAQIIAESGAAARLWAKTGNNRRELVGAAHKELKIINMLFGFYMDRQQNAIGATGWDWIRGNILGNFARRS